MSYGKRSLQHKHVLPCARVFYIYNNARYDAKRIALVYVVSYVRDQFIFAKFSSTVYVYFSSYFISQPGAIYFPPTFPPFDIFLLLLLLFFSFYRNDFIRLNSPLLYAKNTASVKRSVIAKLVNRRRNYTRR